jgi:hypothetical protein
MYAFFFIAIGLFFLVMGVYLFTKFARAGTKESLERKRQRRQAQSQDR